MALIIKNSDALFEQINGFVDENFKISYDYETAKENLDILFDYLKSNNYVLNSDIVKDLLLKNMICLKIFYLEPMHHGG